MSHALFLWMKLMLSVCHLVNTSLVLKGNVSFKARGLHYHSVSYLNNFGDFLVFQMGVINKLCVTKD